MNIFQTDRFWCGTEDAYTAYVAENKHAAESKPTQTMALMSSDAQEAPPLPRLLDKQGEIGVITISGSLVNTDSWVNEWLGRTGYPEIRDALVHAAGDPNIKAIVLDIKSGGGHVSGVSDTGALIASIDKKLKPVHAFSDAMMASAALWLGVNARTVSVGKMAEVGSIGVLVVHQENSKMLEEMGVNTTVIRSGKYKALGISSEKLSELGKEVIQAQVDQMNEMFVAEVAAARGTTAEAIEKNAGQGRVFIGQDAVDAGLADSVTTFDALMSKITRGIDSAKKVPQYGGNSLKGTPTMAKALTEQQLAALAEGGTLTPVAAAAAVVIGQLQAEAPAPVEATQTTAEQPAVTTVETPAKPAESPELVAFLKTSLAEAQAANTDLTIQLRDAKAASEKMTASHTALRQIAEASVDRLKVALGGTAGGAQALADESLLAEHASLRAQFESKFKAGGVAAVSSSGSSDKDSVVDLDPVRQARLASTRFAK